MGTEGDHADVYLQISRSFCSPPPPPQFTFTIHRLQPSLLHHSVPHYLTPQAQSPDSPALVPGPCIRLDLNQFILLMNGFNVRHLGAREGLSCHTPFPQPAPRISFSLG